MTLRAVLISIDVAARRSSNASRRTLFPASRRCCHRPAPRRRRHGRPQVLHHLLTQPRRLHRRLALGHLAPLLQQRADALVRHAIAEIVILALPRSLLARFIAVPASPVHASLSATVRQAWHSVLHGKSVAACTHTWPHGSSRTTASARPPSAPASIRRIFWVRHRPPTLADAVTAAPRPRPRCP